MDLTHTWYDCIYCKRKPNWSVKLLKILHGVAYSNFINWILTFFIFSGKMLVMLISNDKGIVLIYIDSKENLPTISVFVML